jgi:hypothetical protein
MVNPSAASAYLRHATRRLGAIAARFLPRSPQEDQAMARQMTCDCGKTLTALDDNELFREAKEHVHFDHSDMVVTDGQVRDLVAAKATDAAEAAPR